MSRSAEMKTEYGTYKPWHKARIRSFVCTSGWTETGHPAQPIAKQNVPDARTGFSQRISLPLFYHKGRGIYISKLFLYQKIKFKERKR